MTFLLPPGIKGLIFIQSVYKRTSLNGCFWQDRGNRENIISTTFAANPLVLEMPKIGFKICLVFFLTKMLISGYFSCVCKVTSKVAQALSRILFYSKKKNVLLTYFLPKFYSYAPRKHRGFLIFFQRVWLDSIRTLVATGFNSFHNFHLFFFEQPPRHFQQNRCSATRVKNLKKTCTRVHL